MGMFETFDDFADGLWDHLFSDRDDVSDEEEEDFNHLLSFFEEKQENRGRRSNGSGSGGNSRRRSRRSQSSSRVNAPRGSRRQEAGFGNARWFGN